VVGDRLARLDHQHELVVVQRQRLERRMVQLADEADVDVAAHGQVEDLLGVPGPDAQAHLRVGGLEADEEIREDVGADRRRGAQHQLVGDRQALDRARAVLEGPHRALRVRQERAAGISQGHPAPAAPEERAADLRFERPEPGSQRGLGDEQGLGSATQVRAPCDLEEAFDLCQLHSTAPSSTLRRHVRSRRSRSIITLVDGSDQTHRLDLMPRRCHRGRPA
jgi:hypothetical protein